MKTTTQTVRPPYDDEMDLSYAGLVLTCFRAYFLTSMLFGMVLALAYFLIEEPVFSWSGDLDV